MFNRRTNLHSTVSHITYTAGAPSKGSPAHFPCQPHVPERHPALGTSVLVFAYAELRRGLVDLTCSVTANNDYRHAVISHRIASQSQLEFPTQSTEHHRMSSTVA